MPCLFLPPTPNYRGPLEVLRSERPMLFAAICGGLLASTGFVSGSTTYGTGYVKSGEILRGTFLVPLVFGPLKFASMVISYQNKHICRFT